jgi:DNA recombination protein RmuC
MNPTAYFLIGALAAALLILLFLRRRSANDASSLLLQQQLDGVKSQMSELSQTSGRLVADSLIRMQESLNAALKNVTDNIGVRLQESKSSLDQTNVRLDKAAEVIQSVRQELGSLGEKTKSLSEIGKDITRLSDIFQSPKLRGNLGELILENLLEQMMPRGSYALQHTFRSNNTHVDAVLAVGGRLIPVDAKFPLENFRRFMSADLPGEERDRLRKEFVRDVKKHVDDIAGKYILPAEGTLDFALMYIPSEPIYYEIITRGGDEGALLEHAARKRVIPVSPNTFFAYLQVILFGLKGLEIEKSARDIQARLQLVQADFAKFIENFRKVGEKIDAAKKEYDGTTKRFELLDRRMGRITGREGLAELEAIPGPPLPPP